MTRELVNPDSSVRIEDGMVQLRFMAPGSKFGPVYVNLEPDRADVLLADLACVLNAELRTVAP